MWLVLCSAHDLAALWAYEGLVRRGVEPLELVAAEVLGCSLRWEHRLGVGGVGVEIDLADGRRILGAETRGALNRLQAVPMEPLATAAPEDVEYATQELFAFYLSWLRCLPGTVLNPPTPQGLSGRWRHVSEWALLAARAGLRPLDYRWTPGDGWDDAGGFGGAGSLAAFGEPVRTVLAVGDRVIGRDLPPEVAAGCRRLGRLAETPLLGIDFVDRGQSRWSFAGATPMPDLRLGGDELLDALAAELTDGSPA